MDLHAAAFASIYANKVWGIGTPSGPGSETRFNDRYLALLQSFVDRQDVNSVLDVGCGDWNLGRQIDWSSVTYLGVDVVAGMIERNTKSFGASNVAFRTVNGVDGELPPADLVIVKDVMQHLSNRDVHRLLDALCAHPLVLVTNDVACRRPDSYPQPWDLPPATNADIAPGNYRPVQLDESPFALPCETLLSYEVPCETMIFRKETVVWCPANALR